LCAGEILTRDEKNKIFSSLPILTPPQFKAAGPPPKREVLFKNNYVWFIIFLSISTYIFGKMNVLHDFAGKLTFITLPFTPIVFSTGLIRSVCNIITISPSALVKAIAL
jgi:hypothetical protein